MHIRHFVVALAAALLVSACDDTATITESPGPFAGEAFSKINSNDFYQCQTGNPDRVACNWISGVLNATHNIYFEDDVIPQKLRLNEANGHTRVILEYGFRKGGTDNGILTGDYHGNYDFMARWDNGTGPNDYCEGDRRMDGVFCENGSPAGVTTGDTEPVPGPLDPQTTLDGLTSTEIAAYQKAWDRYLLSKPAELVVLGALDNSLEITSLTFDRSGDASTARMVFTFDADPAAGGEALMLWGMHFAYGGDWDNAGDDLWHGASGQSGSPFHTKLIEVRTGIQGSDYTTGKVLNNGAMAINVSGDVVIRNPSASITVDADGTNEVGDEHPVTATVLVDPDDGSGPAPAPGIDVSFTLTGTGSFKDGIDSCTTGADGTCTVHIVSSEPGLTQVHASASPDLGSGPELITTSDPVDKTWVDGYIQITPASATNPVGEAHEITATVAQFNGSNTEEPVADGTVVTFSFVGATDAVFVGGNTCTTTGGVCSIFINSNSVGTTTIHAAVTINVGGISIVRETDGTGLNSGDATKTYAAARISVTPSGVNWAGESHDFTALVERDDGAGYIGVANVTVTGAPSGAGSLSGDGTCQTGSDGTCILTATSSFPGVMVLDVSANVPVNGGTETIPVSTSGVTGDFGPATKRWVDVQIAVAPLTDENLLGTPHTITATLNRDLGDGAGFQAFGPDETVNWTIESGPGSLDQASCTTDAQGQCSVVLSNDGPTTTQTVVRASWTGTVSATEGTTIEKTVATGTTASPDATKDWVPGSIAITKDVEVGPFTAAPQVCFTLARTDNDGTLPGDVTAQQCHTFSTGDLSHDFSWTGLVAGTYSITETVDPPYAAMSPNPITGIVLDDENRDYTHATTIQNPLPKGALQIVKTLNGFSDLMGLTFNFDVYACDTGSSATECLSPTALAGNPVVVSDANNPATVTGLDEGWYQVTEQDPGYLVEPSLSQIVQVMAGGAAADASVSFNNVQLGDVCEDGKPRALIMLYNGNGTANDSHNQESGEVIINVTDDATIGDREHPVTIRTYDHRDKVIDTFTGVMIGDQIRFESNRNNQLVPPRAGFRVFDASLNGGQLNDVSNALEHVQFHSSCSQPLAPGDEFGSFQLLRDEN